MARVLRPGGLLLLTTRGIGFKYHSGPGYDDYWRFTEDGMKLLLRMGSFTVVELVPDPYKSGWFALGRKEE